MLEPLYQYHYLKRLYEIQPLVAASLPIISENGKLITVQIKKGVKFHIHPSLKAGRELNAHDFVVQFKRLSMESLKSPGRSLFLDVIEGFDSYGKEIKDVIEAIYCIDFNKSIFPLAIAISFWL